jgi:deoxyribonuclease-4
MNNKKLNIFNIFEYIKMDCCCCTETFNDKIKKINKLNIKIPECRCGDSIRFEGSIYKTLLKNNNCKCKQFFLGDPINYKCYNITEDDKIKTQEFCKKTDTTFYIHCPFVANLAKDNSHKSIEVLSNELNVVKDLPAACVLHIGKVGTIKNVADNLNYLTNIGKLPISTDTKVPFKLLLENAAGQGTELGRNWEEIRHLYEALDHTKVGICIDTQHAFASNMCSFQTHQDVVNLFDEASYITKQGISMIHLNDSFKPINSNVDRHAPVSKGHIWYKEKESFETLLDFAYGNCIDLISETSDPNNDIDIINNYMNNNI